VILTRVPAPQLRPFVSRLRATDVGGADAHGAPAERVLPTGKTHLALRLGSEPLRIFDDPTGAGAATLGWAVVGGVRTGPYYKDVSRPVPSVGAVLEPGAPSLLFDAPADALAGRHTPLEAIWGAQAELSPKRCARLRRFQYALCRAAGDSRASWADVALAAGYCDQPHFTREFREFAGLSPGDYRRPAGGSPDRANHVPLPAPGAPSSSRRSRPAS